jgi:hypothetical protein
MGEQASKLNSLNRKAELVFVHPNDEDKYSYRDNEKKDSGQDPIIQGVCIIVFGLVPVCQKSDTRGFESSPLPNPSLRNLNTTFVEQAGL